MFPKRPILLDTCATCSELPSYISTMARILRDEPENSGFHRKYERRNTTEGNCIPNLELIGTLKYGPIGTFAMKYGPIETFTMKFVTN